MEVFFLHLKEQRVTLFSSHTFSIPAFQVYFASTLGSLCRGVARRSGPIGPILHHDHARDVLERSTGCAVAGIMWLLAVR